MRKITTLILILTMLFTLSACGSKAMDEQEVNAPEEDTLYIELNRQMIESYDTSMVEYAYAFGLPDDIHWIDKPETEADYQNNILYLLLIGDYGLNIAFPKEMSQEELDSWGQKLVDMVYDFGLDTYDGLAAFYINEGINYRINWNEDIPIIELYSTGEPYENLKFVPIDFKQVFEEQKEALKDALILKDKLHTDGTIKDDMTQKEIMQAYYHALAKYTEMDETSVKAMDKNNTYSDAVYDYNCSTIYGFHSIRYCTCGGRAAGFGLSMRLEGIPCYGISVPGHEINVCFIDGKEYYIDTGNQIPAMNIDKCRKVFERIDEHSDIDARNALKRLNGEPIPELGEYIEYGELHLNSDEVGIGNTFEVAKGTVITGTLIADQDVDKIVSNIDFNYQFESDDGKALDNKKFKFKHEGDTITLTIPKDFDEPNFFLHYYSHGEDESNPYLFTDNGPFINFIIKE